MQVDASRLTPVILLSAGLALSAISVPHLGAEIAPYAAAGASDERRFAAISMDRYRPADSRLSRALFMSDCLEVTRSIYGRVQPESRRRSFLLACRRGAEAVVSEVPTAADAWLVSALASAELGEFDAMNAALHRAWQSAPRIQHLADRRSRVAEENFDRLTEATRQDYERDLVVLALGYEGMQVLAERYVRRPERREDYRRAVEQAPPAQRSLFLRQVRSRVSGAGA